MDTGDLEHLVALAQAGSLSAAAKRLGVAISTVGRRLAALEADLGLALVDRRADGVRLTPHGDRIVALAGPLLDQRARIERAAAALREGDSRDSVLVSATEFVVADILAPALPALWAARPGVMVTLRSDAAVVSLAARAADVAVRMSRPEGASLYARRLAELPMGLFAGPGYLAGRDPAALDLGRERLLVYDDSYGRLPEMDWLGGAGLTGAVGLATGSTRALLAAATAGAGIALLPVPIARRAGLVAVPAPLPLPRRAPWIVVHRDARPLPGVRAVQAWITACFRALHSPPTAG